MNSKTDVIEITIPSEVCQDIKQSMVLSETLRIKIQNNLIKQRSVTEEDPSETKQNQNTPDRPPKHAPNTIKNKANNQTKSSKTNKTQIKEQSVHVFEILEDRMKNNILTSAEELKQLSGMSNNLYGSFMARLRKDIREHNLILKLRKKHKQRFYILSKE